MHLSTIFMLRYAMQEAVIKQLTESMHVTHYSGTPLFRTPLEQPKVS